jgi:1,4-dihydroxy-2-naphthoyl-CoA synthase
MPQRRPIRPDVIIPTAETLPPARAHEEQRGMDYSSYNHLLFERREHGVLLVTMNRPEVYNAADEAMHSQLATLWADVARDDETRVAVITGATTVPPGCSAR